MPIKELSDGEAAVIRSLLSALEPVFQAESNMPARCIQALLMVAEHDGFSMSEYARQAGMSTSTMSRNLLDLGIEDRNANAGLELVWQQRNPNDPRRNEYHLTPKGMKLVRQMTSKFKRKP
jgi:DNA-binding MarR family transcriptional regulator